LKTFFKQEYKTFLKSFSKVHEHDITQLFPRAGAPALILMGGEDEKKDVERRPWYERPGVKIGIKPDMIDRMMAINENESQDVHDMFQVLADIADSPGSIENVYENIDKRTRWLAAYEYDLETRRALCRIYERIRHNIFKSLQLADSRGFIHRVLN
jgi:hypothetical protein